MGLKYYSKIEDELLSEILIQASINTENQLMMFFDSRFQECLDNDRSTGAYILFIKVDQWIIEHILQMPLIEQTPPIILDSNSTIWMDNMGKDNKNIRHISTIIHFVINGEE